MPRSARIPCRTASWRLSSSTSKTRPETVAGDCFNNTILACSSCRHRHRPVALFLAFDTTLRRGNRPQAARRNRLRATRADAVGAVFDAPQSPLNHAQFLGIGLVAIQEEPFLLALLRHIAVVAGSLLIGNHGGRRGAHQ